ncbi:MATE family efflux transporter [Streptomyces sp. NPDC004609]|uniref:MATE family efflux transporter n=1 Tax=Streptomyces sp. NPDC004609 TaxID=3364704 RepID=UPI00368698B6
MVSAFVRDGRALAVLAVPLVLTQLAQVALTTTDTVMMGLLGARELAAGGLAVVVFNQLRTMGVGLMASAGNRIAAEAARAERAAAPAAGHARPAGEDTPGARTGYAGTDTALPGHGGTDANGAEVRAVVRASMAVATLAGVAGAALMILIGQALPLLGQDPAVVELTRSMLLALAPGLLPCLWFQALRQFSLGMRRPQALLRITLLSVAVNAGLNWVLVHGTWGVPRLGLTGIGAATSAVHLLSFLALVLLVKRDAGLAPLIALNPARADVATTRRLIALGVPTAATYGSEAGFFSVTALMAGSFGTAALAAHTAVNQLVYIVFQIGIGLSHAASINVSRELALGRTEHARRIRNAALALTAAVMTPVAALYLAVPRLILTPFLDPTAEAHAVAVHLLVVTAFLHYADCAQNIGVGLLRSLDHTRTGFRITLVGYWAIGLPAAWACAYPLGLRTLGIWLGLLTGLAATAVLLLRHYSRTLRQRDTAPTAAAAA